MHVIVVHVYVRHCRNRGQIGPLERCQRGFRGFEVRPAGQQVVALLLGRCHQFLDLGCERVLGQYMVIDIRYFDCRIGLKPHEDRQRRSL
jgi:hypothetical protein